MRTLSYLVSSSPVPFFLVSEPVSAAPVTTVDAPVDLVFIADVSGSMTYALGELKRQIKNLLPRVLRGGDTFSLVYFSGPGQCAALVEEAPIRSGGDGLTDITALHQAIDRLDTIGLTCFTDPLVLLADLGVRMKRARPTSRRAVIFGSDGFDNQSRSRKAILDAVVKAMGHVDRFTTLGTGWGCDQGLLQEMAAVAGGAFMFSDDVARYARDFEAAAARRPDGVRRKTVKLGGDPIDGLAFTVSEDGTITQYAVEAGAVSVPENAGAVWYLSGSQVGAAGEALSKLGAESEPVTAAYAALVLFAQRCRRKVVRALARGIGDARFVRIAIGCFGPQRYNLLADAALEAVRAASGTRFVEGVDVGAEPDPHAYTVIDALHALRRGDNRVVPGFNGWTYKPITRGRVAAGEVVTAEEVATIADLTAKLAAGAALEELASIEAAIKTIRAAKAPKVTYNYLWADDGYAIDGIVMASEEANISVRIQRPIALDLSAAVEQLPEHLRAVVPTSFASKRYSTYTIITGRVLNTPDLPLILDAATWAEFARAGLVSGPHRREPVLVNFASLPIVNDAMVEGLSAADVVRVSYALEEVKAALKVSGDLKKKHLPQRESSVVASWVQAAGLGGDDAAAVTTWLDGLGITDNGYQPPSAAAAKTGDVRRSWTLDVAIPGLSSLPTVDKVREKIAKVAEWKKSPKGKEPKLTRAEALMAPHIIEADGYLAASAVDVAKLDDKGRGIIAAYVEGKTKALDPKRRDLLGQLGAFSITAICGGEWFSDMAIGETSVEVMLGGEKVAVGVDVKDVDIAL